MGVLGLWRLLDSAGKPVPLETLEGKVLAIDISIWIHQVIQGYQDRRGNAVPNAHLIGLFNRICKLMYYKIKPVFVFDGGVPLLKKNTIAMRRKLKSITATKAHKLRNDLINNVIKHTVIKGTLEKGNETVQQFKDLKPVKDCLEVNDMYKLADAPSTSKLLDSDDYIDSDNNEVELSPRKQTKWIGNIHSVDVNTEEFKSLPADVRYDILTDLKETRKQNSWGRLHELPSDSNKYSGFQVKRLLKRRFVQESLEIAEKEMGGKTLTLEELDKLLTDQGVDTTQHHDVTYRIASDSVTRVVYIKDKPTIQINSNKNIKDFDNLKLNLQKNKGIDTIDSEVDTLHINSDTSVVVMNNIDTIDLDENGLEPTYNISCLKAKNIPKSIINPALAYMLEHSGLNKDQISKIVDQTKTNKKKSSSNSSNSSSDKGRKTPSILPVINKKKKLSDSITVNTSKVNKKIKTNVEIFNTLESNLKINDVIQIIQNISHKEQQNIRQDFNTTKIMESDSESDDFIEIEDIYIPKVVENTEKNKNTLKIEFQTAEKLEDDIFADVFSNTKNNQKDVSLQNQEILQKKKEIFSRSEKEIKLFDGYTTVKKNKEVEKSACPNVFNKHRFLFSSSKDLILEHDNIASLTMHKNINADIQINNQVLDSKTTMTRHGNIVSETKLLEKTLNQDYVIVTDGYTSNISQSDQVLIKDNLLNFEEVNKKNPENMNNNYMQNELHERTLEVKSGSPLNLPLDEKELELMKKQLEDEQQHINRNLGKLERQATDITAQMRFEAQELLRLFGVPYIIAPMEAEAQCAYLEQIKLIDGTITDDSDVWLFGSHCVYKNFFDNNKKVLQFLSKDIIHHLKISRKEMIQLALLVGSDYTNGLSGVGPVTALEILAAFPSKGEDILHGLRNFSTWFKAGRLATFDKNNLRNKLKNVNIEKGFPSETVVQAYLSPTIDESTESFSWDKPNLILLADYVRQKFGWTKFKFEEIITPVMKKLMSSKSQKGIEWYFKVHSIPKSIETRLSKRVKVAVEKLSKINQGIEASNSEVCKSTEISIQKIRKVKMQKGKKSQSKSSKLSPIFETVDDNNLLMAEKSDEIIKDVIKKGTQKLINVDEEIIPQKEKDKCNALKSKLKAIEIFRKSKKGLDRTQKAKKIVNKVKFEAVLSESSSSSS